MSAENELTEQTSTTTDARRAVEAKAASDVDPLAEADPILEIEGVSKSFGSERAVENFSITVRDGELLTLLGPSGCGKTTTLRTIAGLERPDAGRLRINDEPVAGEDTFVPPERRDVGLVFQEFALFPHLSVGENVGFGIDEWPDEKRNARVEKLLTLVGLAGKRDSAPGDLSGGQRQRVALARALAPDPDVLLLDEPFSNLDKDLRVEMREEVRDILKTTDTTAVFVTHDQEEAMSISDRIAVMSDGQLRQLGRPEDVFQHPQSRFVAGFLGHASFLSAYVRGDAVTTELGTIDRDRIHGLAPAYDRMNIDLLVRPDDVTARPADGADVDGRVTYRRYLGPSVMYRVELDSGAAVECMHNHSESVRLDQPVAVELTTDHDLAWFPREKHTDK